MPLAPGTYALGPENARLLVNTSRLGTAARAGHDLTIEVTSWSGRLEVQEGGATVSLDADGGSLLVREGTGGLMSLGEDDKDNIRQTIDNEVLKRASVEFRSTAVEFSAEGNHLHVDGDLELAGSRHPISFELTVAQQGRLMGRASVKQSDWGIKPYSALFGALRVADDVEVTIDGELTSTAAGDQSR
jgi:polyisoprenoid-binding protein YceI